MSWVYGYIFNSQKTKHNDIQYSITENRLAVADNVQLNNEIIIEVQQL